MTLEELETHSDNTVLGALAKEWLQVTRERLAELDKELRRCSGGAAGSGAEGRRLDSRLGGR